MDLKKEIWAIYSINLAKYLIRQGHELISCRPITDCPNKVYFGFKNTEKLHNDIAEYEAARRKYFGGV